LERRKRGFEDGMPFVNLSAGKWNAKKFVGGRVFSPRPKKFFLTVGAEGVEVEEPRGMKRGHKQVEAEKKPVVEKVRRDFFGRVIVEHQAVDEGKRRRTDSSHALKIQPDVWVRYHEGYSNAVRKPVVFAELLGRV